MFGTGTGVARYALVASEEEDEMRVVIVVVNELRSQDRILCLDRSH